jgi:glucose-6-phosphate 1-dehydrogenase
MVEVTGAASDSSTEACETVRPKDPCSIVIFGASGDLTARKLVPALYNLYRSDGLPKPFTIVGCSRTPLSDDEFRGKLREALAGEARLDLTRWDDFAAGLSYRPVAYESVPSFATLAESLRTLDRETRTQGNRIFYLAVPPSIYPAIAHNLGQSGLAQEGEHDNGWARIVVEKPFGRDLKTAIELDQSLHRSFAEEQIFRIDHYLAKETVQNIVVFRFANAIFEPIWNRRYIDHICITSAEAIGVENRAAYYEPTGVIRDMFQNHMMQLLALTAMEPPSVFEADRVQDEKVKVFRALRPFPVGKVDENLVLGQYGAGTIAGRPVVGYRQEPGVRPDSPTPTYARMRVFLDNWRWQGVPFLLTSGKRLANKLIEIVIHFKEVPHSLFRSVLGEHITANRLTLGIHPDEVVHLTFQTKRPGRTVCLKSVTMRFDYHKDYGGPYLDAYERALLDSMDGDRTLFWRQDGIEHSWSFLSPILEHCECASGHAVEVLPYAAGSWGPEAAAGLISKRSEREEDGRR